MHRFNPPWTPFLLACCLLGCQPAAVRTSAQEPPDPYFVRDQIFPSYNAFREEVNRIVNISDPIQRSIELDHLWDNLRHAGQVPYAQQNQVAFLYRSGGAQVNVSWPGDFNRWNPQDPNWRGTRLGETDLYILETTMPTDARLDYKLYVNGVWLLDPANPLLMWGGFGPNNELRMPDYRFPLETVHRQNVPHGSISDNRRISSSSLGYDVQYRVYTPPGYGGTGNLPVVYVTDGHEYAVDYLGAMVDVMDNLIADRQLQPLIAVFIDPRNPDNLGQNRRGSEYVTNPRFAAFVADELVPLIDDQFTTDPSADARTILGTSLGGLNSAYFGAVRTDTFRNIAIQSPAFGVDSEIYAMYQDPDLADQLKIFMTNGNIQDDGGAFRMAQILSEYGYDFEFTTVNESHSWGNWRGQLDDILTNLVGPPVPEPSSAVLLLMALIVARAKRSGARGNATLCHPGPRHQS
jgi:enterochelin esterase family protein